jgi:hypothetical protein
VGEAQLFLVQMLRRNAKKNRNVVGRQKTYCWEEFVHLGIPMFLMNTFGGPCKQTPDLDVPCDYINKRRLTAIGSNPNHKRWSATTTPYRNMIESERTGRSSSDMPLNLIAPALQQPEISCKNLR